MFKILPWQPPPWSAPWPAPPLVVLLLTTALYNILSTLYSNSRRRFYFYPPLGMRFMTAHMFSEITKLSMLVPIFLYHCLWGRLDGRALGSDMVGIAAPCLPSLIDFAFCGSHYGCFRAWEHGDGTRFHLPGSLHPIRQKQAMGKWRNT